MQVLEEKYGGKLVGKGGDNPPRPTPEWFRLCGGTSADCRNDPLGANANVEVSLLEDNNRQKLQIGTRFLYNDVGGKVKVAVLRPNGKVKTKYHKGAMGEDGRINLCGGEGGGGEDTCKTGISTGVTYEISEGVYLYPVLIGAKTTSKCKECDRSIAEEWKWHYIGTFAANTGRTTPPEAFVLDKTWLKDTINYVSEEEREMTRRWVLSPRTIRKEAVHKEPTASP